MGLLLSCRFHSRFIRSPAALRAFAAHLHRLGEPSASSPSFSTTSLPQKQQAPSPAFAAAAAVAAAAVPTTLRRRLPCLIALLGVDEMAGLGLYPSGSGVTSFDGFDLATALSPLHYQSAPSVALRELEKTLAMVQSAVVGWGTLEPAEWRSFLSIGDQAGISGSSSAHRVSDNVRVILSFHCGRSATSGASERFHHGGPHAGVADTADPTDMLVDGGEAGGSTNTRLSGCIGSAVCTTRLASLDVLDAALGRLALRRGCNRVKLLQLALSIPFAAAASSTSAAADV